MKHKAVILPAAKEDLRLAAKWYNQISIELRKQFLSKFKEKLNELKNEPFICQIRYSEVHTALMKQFPYMIHYFIAQNETIVVISVLHTSRNPEIWNERV